MNDITFRIKSCLTELENDEQVRVLYACESGSRAWGFESTDSDYDVRFIYVRAKDWYLSIDEKRDVIERPLSDEIDLSGWDLRKALRLLRKSNPPLLEWLQSPIVYLKHGLTTARLQREVQTFYSPTSCMHHYLHMASGNFKDYLKKEIVWRKKYFYVLRPVLACLWIEKNKGPVPMEFQRLIDAILTPGPLLTELNWLIAAKRAGAELDDGPRIEVINQFLETEISRLETSVPQTSEQRDQTGRLDQLFREILNDVWQNTKDNN